VSHKPDGRLPLLSSRPAVTLATLKRAATNFCCLVNRGTRCVNSLPKTVTRQRRSLDLNPCLTAPDSSTLTTRYQATCRPMVKSKACLILVKNLCSIWQDSLQPLVPAACSSHSSQHKHIYRWPQQQQQWMKCPGSVLAISL